MITPTSAQRAAAFTAAKTAIFEMIDQMVGKWAESQVHDDEIHRISDAVAKAVVNVPTPQLGTLK